MYIAPDTNIRLLRNVPLSQAYDHTLYFSSRTSQTSYFTGLTKYNLNDQSYQRMQQAIRVGINAENLYDCNYLMFQNSAFGNKWFYAFITDVEYINNNVSKVIFEIDSIQTWFLFDCTLKQSFVEREHSVTDVIGENLVPENVELGDYIALDFMSSGYLGPKSIVMACTFNLDLNNVAGGTYAGIYSGLYYNVFSTYTAANTFIERATEENKSDGIVACFMMPTAMILTPGETAKTFNLSYRKITDNINGYVPKNKKLFTHPYNFLYCTNLNGNYAEFKYEYFTDPSSCTFLMTGDMTCNPTVMVAPTNYKGVLTNYNERIILDGWPQCAFTTDTFKAWLAQNASSLAVSTMSSALSAGIGAGTMVATGGLMGAGQTISGITGVANIIAKATDTSSLPRQAHGSPAAGVNSAVGIQDFAFMHTQIRAEFAKIIDDYFNMFGYATHEVKVPNISSRPYWNYVKTQNVVITGAVPATDLVAIKNCFNRGITFWKNGSNVGNYSLNNSPS